MMTGPIDSDIMVYLIVTATLLSYTNTSLTKANNSMMTTIPELYSIRFTMKDMNQ